MTNQVKNKQIIINVFLITICTSVYIFGFSVSFLYLLKNFSIDSLRNFIEYGTMYISFLFFCGYLWKYKYLRIISIILLLLISINFMISMTCFLVYKQSFNIGMSISILETNINEIKSMFNMYWLQSVISVFFFILQIFTIQRISRTKIRFKIILGTIWIMLPFIFFLKHKYVSNKGGGHMIKSVFYHGLDIYNGYKLQKEIEGLKNIENNYTYKIIKPSAKNIVLLIGESVTPRHMSLYGYKRNTTPNEVNEKNNMLIFENAVSPAGITNLSVPLILSNIKLEDFQKNYNKISDNIISLANHYNYKTYWYSTQSSAKGITAIASFAKEKKWIDGYDEEILPFLKKAIQEQTKAENKKMIILHINGSHPNPCDKYPSDENYFKNDRYIDCYDNSIHYTDKVIGEIFNILKDKEAALFYLSDHSLKIENSKFIHADSFESTQVPFYIWNSPLLNITQKQVGSISKQTQTRILYPMIMKYMGLEVPENYFNKELKYLKLDLSVIDYKLLE